MNVYCQSFVRTKWNSMFWVFFFFCRFGPFFLSRITLFTFVSLSSSVISPFLDLRGNNNNNNHNNFFFFFFVFVAFAFAIYGCILIRWANGTNWLLFFFFSYKNQINKIKTETLCSFKQWDFQFWLYDFIHSFHFRFRRSFFSFIFFVLLYKIDLYKCWRHTRITLHAFEWKSAITAAAPAKRNIHSLIMTTII